VAATRLHRALGIEADDANAICTVLRLHPAFLPGYFGVGVDGSRLWLEDGEAFREGDPYGWYALPADAALPAMVQAATPRARGVPRAPGPGQQRAWEIVVDRNAEPAAPPPEVAMVAGTSTAGFTFRADARA